MAGATRWYFSGGEFDGSEVGYGERAEQVNPLFITPIVKKLYEWIMTPLVLKRELKELKENHIAHIEADVKENTRGIAYIKGMLHALLGHQGVTPPKEP